MVDFDSTTRESGGMCDGETINLSTEIMSVGLCLMINNLCYFTFQTLNEYAMELTSPSIDSVSLNMQIA